MTPWYKDWRFAMAVPNALRDEFGDAGLRPRAKASKDAGRTGRFPVLAVPYD